MVGEKVTVLAEGKKKKAAPGRFYKQLLGAILLCKCLFCCNKSIS